MKGYVKTFNFSRGLQTKALEDGLPLPEFVTFQNVRVNQGVARRRPGMKRIAELGTDIKALVLDGSSEYLDLNNCPAVWALPLRFTVEGLVSVTDKTATNTFLYAGVNTSSIVIDTASNKLRLRVWDSSATLTTVMSTNDIPQGSAFSFQCVRDGADLSVRIDNGTADTGTMDGTKVLRTPSGALRVGRDTGSNYLDATYDYLRCFGRAKSDHADRLVRFPDPKATYVIADYDFSLSNRLAKDRSRNENHLLERTGTTSQTTALAHSAAPSNLIHGYQSGTGKRVLITAGGRVHDVEVG